MVNTQRATEEHKLTFTDHFTINVPITQYGKEERQSVYNGHGQAQFWLSSLVTNISAWQRFTRLSAIDTPRQPFDRRVKKAQLTSLSNKQEEPDASCKIKNQWDCVTRILQKVNDRKESSV